MTRRNQFFRSHKKWIPRRNRKHTACEEVWSAQDTETRPVWLHSPTYPQLPPAPTLHPATDVDVMGAMGQDGGFMLFCTSNKILPGSNQKTQCSSGGILCLIRRLSVALVEFYFPLHMTVHKKSASSVIPIECQPCSLGKESKHEWQKICGGWWC